MTTALLLNTPVCPKCFQSLPPPMLSDFGYDGAKAATAMTTPMPVRCLFGQGRQNACGWSGTVVFARWSDDAKPVSGEGAEDPARPKGLWEAAQREAAKVFGRKGLQPADAPDAGF